jgi:hypothetical protein
MVQVVQGALPDNAALARYSAIGYTDCFCVDVPKDVSFEAYITAFYTSWLFKMERIVLRLVKRPSTDLEVAELAVGTRTRFAAWDVEKREEQQILMCDMAGRTRSWLMVEPSGDGTRLYFGSAVVPDKKSGKMGWVFNALLGFHKVYSVQLLKAAVRNL